MCERGVFRAVKPKKMCTFVVWNKNVLFVTAWRERKDWQFWAQPAQ